MSLFLVRYLHNKRVVTQLVTLVSNILVLISALINIDNTDLCTFDNRGNSIEALIAKVKQLLDA